MKTLAVFLLFLALPVLAGDAPSFPSVEGADVEDAVAAGRVLLDVRPGWQRDKEGRIPGAAAVSLGEKEKVREITQGEKAAFLAAVAARPELGKDAPLLLICSRGTRSALAASILAEAGWTDLAHVIDGAMGNDRGPGLSAWVELEK